MTEPATLQSTSLAQAHGVRRAGRADLDGVVATLSRAFDDDPVVNWIVKQNSGRERHIAWLMAQEVKGQVFRHGEIYTTEDISGASLWLPPGLKRRQPLGERLAMGIGSVRHIGLVRMLRSVGPGLEAVNKKHPRVPHWYLPTIGVDPEHQGRGIGSALLRPILDRCDEQRLPAYLESSKERNVPLYSRFGFRVTEVLDIPPDGPPVWLMFREPQ